MPDRVFSDVKILDLTQYIAGPYCTKLFADYGAEVIKIEKPGKGDPARRLGPFPGDKPHIEKSGLFLHLNTNKKGITLNLKSETGKDIFKKLVKWADIVVENFSPRVMPSLGLDYKTLEKIKPELVMTSISNFGQTCPYRDFKASELILYGMGGEMFSCGVPEREPVKLGDDAVQHQAGVAAATATIGGLLLAKFQNIGQHIDVSIMETMLGGIDRKSSVLIAYQYTGEQHSRVVGWRDWYPAGIYPCKDGYFEITGGSANWARIVEMLGNPKWLEDAKWTAPSAQSDPALKAEFEANLIDWASERTKREIWEAGQAARVVCGPLNTMQDLFQYPHFQQRGFFVQIEHAIAGNFTYPGRPFVMAETPWEIRLPAPLLGEHNEEIYGELGYDRADLVRLRGMDII